jgi:alkaline phosphatase
MKAERFITRKKVLFVILLLQSFIFASPADYPKNIILIIVDGGGFNHIDAADYYACGKKGSQPFEKFPAKLAMTTYSAAGAYDPKKAAEDFNYVKTGFTDSAAAATAMSTGIKTNAGAIGVDINDGGLEHIIERCEKLDMSTGIVTTVPVSHATPAGFVAHQQSRKGYQQIADEMINQSALEVIFGCGNPFFDDNGEKVKSANFKYIGSEEVWNSLIEGSAGSDADGDEITDKWTLIQSRQEFLNLADGLTPRRVIGIAQAATTLQEKRAGNSVAPFDIPFNPNVPSLAEMTKAALNVLDDDNDGFFIMIEAGAVDWASHDNDSARMVEEMTDFRNAAQVVVDWVDMRSSWQKSLMIITADHECGYLTGPDKSRFVVSDGKGKLPQMRWNSTDHTNSLVFFFAKGQGSKLFEQKAKNRDAVYGRYIDNTDIAEVIFALLQRRVLTQK